MTNVFAQFSCAPQVKPTELIISTLHISTACQYLHHLVCRIAGIPIVQLPTLIQIQAGC